MDVLVVKYVNYVANAKYLECWISSSYFQDASLPTKAGATSEEILAVLDKAGLIKKASEVVPQGGPTTEKVLYLKIDLDNGKVLNVAEDFNMKFRYDTNRQNVFKLTEEKGTLIHQTEENKVDKMVGPRFMNSFDQFLEIEISKGSIVGYDAEEMSSSLAVWIDNTGK